MTILEPAKRDSPLILHCFADYGTESEVLTNFGRVLRVGIDTHDTNESEPITADAAVLSDDSGPPTLADSIGSQAALGPDDGARGEPGPDEVDSDVLNFPFRDDLTFDLGVFHPVCSKWASTTSISGNVDDHQNMIPGARALADQYCEHYVIENVPEAPLRDPTVLDGRMFGLPIKYERAFETSFHVPQPPRHQRFVGVDGPRDTVETSSFYFSERSRAWWGSVKGVPLRDYPKQHLAKNTIPAPYVHHVCRSWLQVYEEKYGDAADRPDYSNYDERMEKRRRENANMSLFEFVPSRDES